MNEFDELNIKRSKLEIQLGKFTTLAEFDAYITNEMKIKINEKLDEEALQRDQFSDEEKNKARDLRGIKYKLV